MSKTVLCWLVDWLFGFYGISTFVGYLMPNLLYKYSVLFQTIQAIQFCQTVLIQTIQFSTSTVSISKTVLVV